MIKVMIVEDEPAIRRILSKMIEKQDGFIVVAACGDFAGGIFECEIAHFIDCIRNDKTPSANIDEAVQLQAMLMGIYESSRTGKEVKLTY